MGVFHAPSAEFWGMEEVEMQVFLIVWNSWGESACVCIFRHLPLLHLFFIKIGLQRDEHTPSSLAAPPHPMLIDRLDRDEVGDYSAMDMLFRRRLSFCGRHRRQTNVQRRWQKQRITAVSLTRFWFCLSIFVTITLQGWTHGQGNPRKSPQSPL